MIKADYFKSDVAMANYKEYLKSKEIEWSIDSKNYYIDTSFGPTYVRESGNGEPLVLLPGLSSSSINYREFVKALSKTHRIYALDTVGDIGRSFTNRASMTEDDFIEWQREVYSKLDIIDCFSIIGTSFGAWIGTLYTTKHKGVKSLTLISPAGTFRPLKKGFILRGIRAALLPFTEKWFMKWLFKDHFESLDDPDKELIPFLKELSLHRSSVKPFLRPAPKIISDDDLKSIKCPVLYFVGENEKLNNYQDSVKRFNNTINNGQKHIIKNGGHDISIIKRDYIIERIVDFLS